MDVESSSKIRPVVRSTQWLSMLAFFASTVPQIAQLVAQKSSVTAKDVLPILEKMCFQCHGEALKMGNLDLRTRESMLKGGDKGPALTPGKGDQSLLIHRVTGKVAPAMP